MPKQNFLLVSLAEDKAKDLAQVISNKTCRKILDYLAEKEATETKLAKELDIPLSTVHYNLQQLQKGSLVESNEYHYSEKGKEVNHYRLANKYIIIAPKTTHGIKEKLRSILPVGLFIAATAGVIQYFSRYSKPIQEKAFAAAPQLAEAGANVFEDAVTTAADEVVVAAPEIAQQAISTTSIWQNIALWFIIGAVSAIVIYVIVDKIRKK